jgi:hypothetical protein
MMGISGDTYPVLRPQVEKADTTSKTMSFIGYVVRWNCNTTRVAIKMVTTERIMISMFFAASSSAVALGITLPSILKGRSTFPLTKSLRNHQYNVRKARATRLSLIPPAELPDAPPMNVSRVKNNRVTLAQE